LKAAPDVMGVEAEGIPDQGEAALGSQNDRATNGTGPSPWTTIGDLSGIEPGSMQPIEIDGMPALFLHVQTAYYAYRNRCPGCGSALDAGALVDKYLTCPSCGSQYDVRRAGRCQEQPDVHLEPVPLIMD